MKRREEPLDARRQPEPGEEAEHHARQRRHDLDRRLHEALQARVHELRGVHRAEHAERDREQQRVERALERADEQRRQRELRLEVVVAAARLPDVLRARRSPRTRRVPKSDASDSSGMRVRRRRATASLPGAGERSAVALGREGQRRRGADRRRAAPERAARGRVLEAERAVAARRRGSDRSRCDGASCAIGAGIAREVADPREAAPAAVGCGTANQTLSAPSCLPDDERAAADQQRERGDRRAAGARALGRRVAVAQVEAQQRRRRRCRRRDSRWRASIASAVTRAGVASDAALHASRSISPVKALLSTRRSASAMPLPSASAAAAVAPSSPARTASGPVTTGARRRLRGSSSSMLRGVAELRRRRRAAAPSKEIAKVDRRRPARRPSAPTPASIACSGSDGDRREAPARAALLATTVAAVGERAPRAACRRRRAAASWVRYSSTSSACGAAPASGADRGERRRRAGRSTGATSTTRNAKIPAMPTITARPPARIARPAPRSTATRRRAVAKRPARARARAGPGRCDSEPIATAQRSSLACSCSKIVLRERQIAVLHHDLLALLREHDAQELLHQRIERAAGRLVHVDIRKRASGYLPA